MTGLSPARQEPGVAPVSALSTRNDAEPSVERQAAEYRREDGASAPPSSHRHVIVARHVTSRDIVEADYLPKPAKSNETRRCRPSKRQRAKNDENTDMPTIKLSAT